MNGIGYHITPLPIALNPMTFCHSRSQMSLVVLVQVVFSLLLGLFFSVLLFGWDHIWNVVMSRSQPTLKLKVIGWGVFVTHKTLHGVSPINPSLSAGMPSYLDGYFLFLEIQGAFCLEPVLFACCRH